MLTIISGTNRKGSLCLAFAQQYRDQLAQMTTEEVKLLDLAALPHDWFHPDMYVTGAQAPSLSQVQDEYLIPARAFIIVSSEYNGSFPGVFKLFIDACSIREFKLTFRDKKAALAGVATGRAGNLRGMEHLTGVMNYLGTIVLPNKMPYSSAGKLVDKSSGQAIVTDEPTLDVIKAHAEEFLNFVK